MGQGAGGASIPRQRRRDCGRRWLGQGGCTLQVLLEAPWAEQEAAAWARKLEPVWELARAALWRAAASPTGWAGWTSWAPPCLLPSRGVGPWEARCGRG